MGPLLVTNRWEEPARLWTAPPPPSQTCVRRPWQRGVLMAAAGEMGDDPGETGPSTEELRPGERDLLQRPGGGVVHAGVRAAHRVDTPVLLPTGLFILKQQQKQGEEVRR